MYIIFIFCVYFVYFVYIQSEYLIVNLMKTMCTVLYFVVKSDCEH